MAGRSVFASVARNAALDAGGLCAQFNSGVIKLISGAQPATPETALGGGNTVLATLTLAVSAFGAAAAGVATAAAIAAAAAAASGVANFARIYKSDGITPLVDINIGNQTVTLTAGAAGGATSLTVSPLAQPLFSGQDLWLTDAVDGTLKKASVSANVAAGVTAVPVTALASAIANGSASGQCMTVVNPNIESGLSVAISSLTLTIAQVGG